jgi:hypothetical protein
MLAPDQARKNSWGTPQSPVTGMPSVLLLIKLLEQGTGALHIYISFVTLSSSGNPFLEEAEYYLVIGCILFIMHQGYEHKSEGKWFNLKTGVFSGVS